MEKTRPASLSRPGGRIRDLRLQAGIKQAHLAEALGISPSYLNLIEHDRRRIAGKLLTRVAEVLDVPSQRLTQGTDPDLLAALHGAAELVDPPPDPATAADLMARYPRWAAVIAAQAQGLHDLARQLEETGDRLRHDPALAGTLHDVISTATAIRSTAAILTEDATLDADWLARFHGNIHEDAVRLAASSDQLMEKLGRDAPQSDPATPAPTDPVDPPDAAFIRAARDAGFDPAKLSGQAAPAQILRWLAALSGQDGAPNMGLVVCDGAGVVTQADNVPGFDLARQSGACALWPVFTALGQPGRVVEATVALPGTPELRLLCHAIADPRGPAHFGHPPVIEATMLVQRDPPEGTTPPLPIGPTCRICPRDGCPARRTPSVL